MSESTQVHGVEFKACTCGCGTAVPTKSNYRPGHDAKHAGRIGKAAAEAFLADEVPSLTVTSLYEGLPTASLRSKAHKVALNAVAKANAQGEKAQAKAAAKVERDAAKAKRAEEAEAAKAARAETAKVKADAKRAKREADAAAKVEADKARAEADAAKVEAAKAKHSQDGEAEDIGTIRVGRWTYPVRITSAGKVQRNLARDGSGEWVTIDNSDKIEWAS